MRARERLGELLVGVVEAPVRLRGDEREHAEHVVAGAQRDGEQRGEAERLAQQLEVLVVDGRRLAASPA